MDLPTVTHGDRNPVLNNQRNNPTAPPPRQRATPDSLAEDLQTMLTVLNAPQAKFCEAFPTISNQSLELLIAKLRVEEDYEHISYLLQHYANPALVATILSVQHSKTGLQKAVFQNVMLAHSVYGRDIDSSVVKIEEEVNRYVQLITQWRWSGTTIDLPRAPGIREGNLEQLFPNVFDNSYENRVIKNTLLLCFIVKNREIGNNDIIPEIKQALWNFLDKDGLEKIFNSHLQYGQNFSQTKVVGNTKRAVNCRIVLIRAALEFLPPQFAGILDKDVENQIKLVWRSLDQILAAK